MPRSRDTANLFKLLTTKILWLSDETNRSVAAQSTKVTVLEILMVGVIFPCALPDGHYFLKT